MPPDKPSDRVPKNVPKYRWLKGLLLRRMRTLKPGSPLPTVVEMRQTYGVSQATIERALNELRLEGRIRSRRGSGIYVADHIELRQIGMLIPYNIFDHNFSEFPRLLLRALQSAAAERDMLLRHYIPTGGAWSWDGPLSALRMDIENRQIQGIVAVELWTDGDVDWKVPTVAMEAAPTIKHRVLTDRVACVRLGVQALAGEGCRHIGLISDADAPSMTQEVAAFREALKAAGLNADENLLKTVDGSRPAVYMRRGREALEQMLAAPGTPVDGLVSIDDYATTGALELMAERGLTPNVELKVASLTNQGSPVLADASIWRLEFTPADMAAALLQLLEQMIDGDMNPPSPVKVLPTLRDPNE